jgi:hypothetical protein
VVAIIFYTGCLKKRPTLLAIPASSETSGVNCMQNFKTHSSRWLFKWIVFLKQNDGLIEIYYLKMIKNKADKTNCCVFGCNTCRKNKPEACFYLFPLCGVKAK